MTRLTPTAPGLAGGTSYRTSRRMTSRAALERLDGPCAERPVGMTRGIRRSRNRRQAPRVQYRGTSRGVRSSRRAAGALTTAQSVRGLACAIPPSAVTGKAAASSWAGTRQNRIEENRESRGSDLSQDPSGGGSAAAPRARPCPCSRPPRVPVRLPGSCAGSRENWGPPRRSNQIRRASLGTSARSRLDSWFGKSRYGRIH